MMVTCVIYDRHGLDCLPHPFHAGSTISSRFICVKLLGISAMPFPPQRA